MRLMTPEPFPQTAPQLGPTLKQVLKLARALEPAPEPALALELDLETRGNRSTVGCVGDHSHPIIMWHEKLNTCAHTQKHRTSCHLGCFWAGGVAGKSQGYGASINYLTCVSLGVTSIVEY